MKKEFIINDQRFVPYIDKNSIDKIIGMLSERISKDYSDRDTLFLLTLKGAVIFGTDLLMSMNLDATFDTIKAQSYGNSMTSSGNVVITGLDPDKVENRHVVIIEDIIDTGRTMTGLIREIKNHNPKSLSTVTLLSKPQQRVVQMEADYTGLEIPPVFVIGYGYDFDQRGRFLPEIYGLEEDVEKWGKPSI